VPQDSSDIVLDRLMRLHPKVIDLSLDRIEGLLARLGHPERSLPPVVHIAGTNGKGSVIAYLRAMLEAAGKRVQCYTSPHLVRFHERIRLPEGLIDEARLVALLEHCEEANGGGTITFFEVTTAAAFVAFAETPADILLLETGLGGRLDATNVIDKPLLSVLTPVSIDHTQFLGETLEEIAFEKAGILKAGVPAVIGRQAPEALEVIEKRAEEVQAPLSVEGRDWRMIPEAEGFFFEDATGRTHYPEPALIGAFQKQNAALAVAAMKAARRAGARFDLKKDALSQGIENASWAARLQRLKAGTLVDLLPPDDSWELWVDGGHNPAAGDALSQQLKEWRDKPLTIIFGMINTKAATDYLRRIAGSAERLYALAIPGEINSLTAEEASNAAATAGFSAAPCASVRDALSKVAANSRPGRVLICGSLYLAGRVLAQNDASE